MADDQKIALIFFSRNAASEGRAKQWFLHKASSKNKVLASSLISRSLAALQHTGLPVFHYHEDNQQGKTFGERITRAHQEVFELGYEAVISVGNDCPNIAHTNWKDICQQLASGNCVIGPSLRGGAYLIGLTKEAFDPEQFQQLPWQANKLFKALSEFCAVGDDKLPFLLPALRDINSRYDLKKLLKTACASHYFKRSVLRLFFQEQKTFFKTSEDFPVFSLFSCSPFRGPPLFS